MTLNTREISTALWLALIVLWVFLYRPTRSAAFAVIKAAAAPKIIIPIVLSAIATTGMVLVLRRVGLWTIAEFKDTIVWFAFTGIALIFRGASATNPEQAIQGIIWDTIKVTVLIEFLLNTHTFPLLVELLLFPFATLLALMLALANTEQKYEPAASFLRRLQGILGATVVTITLWSIVLNIRDVFSIENGRSLLLPILLSIAFVPIAYFIALISAYEQLFLPMKMYRVALPLRLYAKMKLIFRLRLNLRGTALARRRMWLKLGRIASRADVDREVSLFTTAIPAPTPPGVDKASYNAGYEIGVSAVAIRGEERIAVHRECDAQISANNYDEASFDQGFIAGEQDSDFLPSGSSDSS
jgi:hypothetical protein